MESVLGHRLCELPNCDKISKAFDGLDTTKEEMFTIDIQKYIKGKDEKNKEGKIC